MSHFRLSDLPACLCSLLLPMGLVFGLAIPSFSQAIFPQATPYELGRFLCSSPQQAIQALDSPDILLRRSGVEWLGNWTGTYMASSVPTDYQKVNAAWMRRHPEIIPKLARAVQEMPDWDNRQAARLLPLFGLNANGAIAVTCAAAARYKTSDPQDIANREEMVDILIRLCGDLDSVVPQLTHLLRNPSAEVRRNAAATLAFRWELIRDRYYVDPSLSLTEQMADHVRRNYRFNQWVIPSLAAHIADRDKNVTLSAMQSLEQLTYNSPDAPWYLTLAPLSQKLASPDPTVRLATLRVLAYMPGDVSSLAPALRTELHDGPEEQKYALAALCHAAGTKRIVVADLFLKDLSSPNLTLRRQAAADVRLIVMPLWAGGFFPDQVPLPWFNDDRLFARYGDPSLTPRQKDEEAKQQQAAQEQTQQRLLTTLLGACSDQDASARTDAASSLDLIGQLAEAESAHGFLFAPAVKSDLTVKQVLIQASAALQTTDLAKAEHFQEMSAYLWEQQPIVFKSVLKK